MLSTQIGSQTNTKGSFFFLQGHFLIQEWLWAWFWSKQETSCSVSELSRNQRPGVAASLRKKSFILWEVPAEDRVAGVMNPCTGQKDVSARSWCWSEVGWMTAPHLNSCEEQHVTLTEELPTAHPPLPKGPYQFASLHSPRDGGQHNTAASGHSLKVVGIYFS